MKSSKESGLHKIFSFILLAVLFILVVGFAVNGWNEDTNKPDSGDVGDKTDDTDENNDGTNNQGGSTTIPDNEQNGDDKGQAPAVPDEPKYINTLTGLEISKEQSQKLPLGFVIDPSLPLYGVSGADLAIEFPTEDGTTRMLSYTTDNSLLWKIGSLVETRAFISGMSNFFGGVVVSYGNDDIVKYNVWDLSKIELDLKNYSNSYFIENTLYIYTSGEMVDHAIENNDQLDTTGYNTAPYIFSDDKVCGNTEANSVIIPYSSNSETELYYSQANERYLFSKVGNKKTDMLSGKNVSFKNVFVLFADATTYDKSIGSELVIDTTGGGTGYYITNGTKSEILWSVNENGELHFTTLAGAPLAVNPGNSYIGYYKASISSSVKVK